jgi:hypothetical protein
MARTYAHVSTSIWQNPDFRSLSIGAQRLYFMLLTQADISSCGVLPLTVKRWAKNAADSDPDSLSIALTELTDSLFLIIDETTEEVLVRTFVKWDGGANNSKRLPAILDAARTIQSTTLMQVTALELAKLHVDHQLPVAVPNSLSDALSHSPSDRAWHSPGVGLSTSVSSSQPTTHNPQPDSATHGASSPVAATSATREEEHRAEDEPRSKPIGIKAAILSREYCDRVKLSDRAKVAGVVMAALEGDYDDQAIKRGLRLLAKESRPVTPDTLRIAIDGKTTTKTAGGYIAPHDGMRGREW